MSSVRLVHCLFSLHLMLECFHFSANLGEFVSAFVIERCEVLLFFFFFNGKRKKAPNQNKTKQKNPKTKENKPTTTLAKRGKKSFGFLQ